MHTHSFTFGVYWKLFISFLLLVLSFKWLFDHVHCQFINVSCFIIRFKHYYHQLDHDAQLTVFVFVNVLLTELQGVTYRHSSSRSSSTLMQAQQQSIDFNRQLTGDTEERLGAIRMIQINKQRLDSKLKDVCDCQKTDK